VRRLLGVLVLAAAALAPDALAQRVAEVQVAPRFVRMRVDAQISVLATAFDADGNPVPANFRWWSSNINVVQVSSDGVIHAVAPGVAIVRAALADSSQRRRWGQTTVFVLRPDGDMPPPGMPEMPSQPPPPRTYVVVPPGKPMMNVDSIIRSSINCGDPAVNAINPAHACWDERARPAERPAVTVPDSCGYGVTPVTLMVRISDGGQVEEVRLFAPSQCPQFSDSAIALVRRLAFTPAQKGGQNVAAWMLIRVTPARSR
jgi:hypothetical protein